MWQIKNEAIKLRKTGLTYTEIKKSLRSDIPKGTLSGWCKGLKLTKESREILDKKVADHLISSRVIAQKVLRDRRVKYLDSLDTENSQLISKIGNKLTAKLMLHSLFLGEGFKNTHGRLAFGNSDEFIIRLFLKLLRNVYPVDESRLHLTVQCRADQDIARLEKYWCSVTNIPKTQLYKAQVDKRTIGKATLKTEYRGVCKIDYMVANVYNDMNSLTRVIGKEFLGR